MSHDPSSELADAADEHYDGFITYSHSADDLLAPRLQDGLQRFAKPWWKRRALRIFRDESSLSASPHLWSSITEALDRSAWFILLLSEDAARSEWVNREIEYWLSHKDPGRIIPVLTDGEFAWSEADIDPSSSAAPPALFGAFAEEPRWVDLRWARTDVQLDLSNARFRIAIADIASAIHRVPKDELESEDVIQHRRTIRSAWAAFLALLLLVVGTTVAGVFAITQWTQLRTSIAAETAAREEAAEQSQIAEDLQRQLETDGGTIDTPIGQITWAHASGGPGSLPALGHVVGIPSGYAGLGVVEDDATGDFRRSYWTSPDGLEWEEGSLPHDGLSRRAGLYEAGGRYWMIADDPTEIWVSSDGMAWEQQQLPNDFNGESARVYEAIGEVWLGSSAGLWSRREGRWIGVSGLAAPEIQGIAWEEFAEPISNGAVTIVSWTFSGSLPVDEILGIEQGQFQFGTLAYWDWENEYIRVEGQTTQESAMLGHWRVEPTPAGAAVRDIDTGEVVHEVIGTIAGMTAEELAELIGFGHVQGNIIGIMSDDGSVRPITPPWTDTFGFEPAEFPGLPPPVVIFSSGDTFFAYVTKTFAQSETPSLELWASIDGETWSSQGVPSFVPDDEEYFFPHVESVGHLFFATVQTLDTPEYWVSQDATSWEPFTGTLGYGQFEQLGDNWIFWGDNLRSEMPVSTDGLNWTMVDTSPMKIVTTPAGDGSYGLSIVSDDSMVVTLAEDQFGRRDIWVLKVES